MGANLMLNQPNIKLDKPTINQAYARLMIANGGLTADDLPVGLVDIDAKNPLLAQISILSQFDEMMISQTPNSPLTRKSILPSLSKPLLPTHLHHLAGQVLADDEIELTMRVLMMIDERGYGVPPTVWLPSKTMSRDYGGWNDYEFKGQIPKDYLAWIDHVKGRASVDFEVLDGDNWDEWYPSARIRHLKALRKHDPKLALDLIVKFAPKESAEKRLDLVSVLAVGLSDDDKDFLISLNKDRSAKVKDEAKRLLARLGVFDEMDKVADELFDELEMGAGGIAFKPTKNAKQRQNRFESLQTVNLAVLAKKFELPLKDFLLAWDFESHKKNQGHHDYNRIFAERMIGLLSDDDVLAVADFFINIMLKRANYDYWGIMRDRLPLSKHQEFASKLFLKGQEFHYLIYHVPDKLNVGFKALQVSSSYKKLIESIQNWQKKNTGYLDNYYIANQLASLGAMIDQDTAKACLVDLYGYGVEKTDPALQVLTLNALLDPH